MHIFLEKNFGKQEERDVIESEKLKEELYLKLAKWCYRRKERKRHANTTGDQQRMVG